MTCEHDDELVEYIGDLNHIGVGRPGEFDPQAFEKAVNDLLVAAGFDTTSTHLHKSAHRVRSLWETRLLGGYTVDVSEVLGGGFEDPREDLITIRDIAIHGTCPHHLLPFRGVAHVTYHPGGRLHGFGRIARLVDAISQRLTYQEWLTRDVAEALCQFGKAKGAAVTIEAEQLCLLLGENRRGAERVRTHVGVGTLKNYQGHASFNFNKT